MKILEFFFSCYIFKSDFKTQQSINNVKIIKDCDYTNKKVFIFLSYRQDGYNSGIFL